MAPFSIPIFDALPETQVSRIEEPACPLIILVITPGEVQRGSKLLSSPAEPTTITLYTSPTFKLTINLIKQSQS